MQKSTSVKSNTLISISISIGINIGFNRVRFDLLSVKIQIVRSGNVCSLLSSISSISSNSAPCGQFALQLSKHAHAG